MATAGSMTRQTLDKCGITERLRSDDPQAMASVFAELYASLRRLAGRALLDERTWHTLGTAGLIGEAYVRLVDQRRTEWRSREHFVAVAAQMMRRILVDYARRRVAGKRGAGMRPL